MRKIWLILASIPLILTPFTGFTWWNFSIFSLLIFFRSKIERWYEGIALPSWAKFILFFIIFGYITEIFAIIDNMPKPPTERALFSPYPLTDLYLAFGYYLAFAIVWYIILRTFKFKYWEVFIIGGSFGILFEQSGKILLSFNFLAWLYVFLVYGSFQASVPAIAENNLGKRDISTYKKIIIGIIAEILAFILAVALLWILELPIK
ncbi:hypothetical protein [Candidatus Aciduliprofundum boonei]|uniref:Uncharacterized protein n=1 Tax=Aciduliprofundum boonei (strain DSM 19572 / T469) TaxID=439481 RepID=B5ICM8_ACIB4|nr:hypothetical protein [Candidatus Aciduliprofundum boonei]ADD09107.1 hypothetical protein Aboo_1299 [Aciduliprofundum boonei T469]EDY35960.1 hypothetical protein ABOONEI_2921 [Aciduliprofundum boonei T469]HII55359.1 hypothetical protein [Candidatus Aciduliprofundum boonei]